MQIGVLLQTNQQISEFIMFYTRYVWWSFLVNLKVRFVAFECWNMEREKKNWRKSRKEKEANVCIKEEERAKPWRTKTETKSVLLMISLFRVRNSFFNMQNARCLKNGSESVQNVSPSFARSLSLSRIIIKQKKPHKRFVYYAPNLNFKQWYAWKLCHISIIDRWDAEQTLFPNVSFRWMNVSLLPSR